MKVPLLDLKKEYKLFRKEIHTQLKKCFESQMWILGRQVDEFERKVAKYLGTKYAIGVASGTDALVLALKGLALKVKGKEFFSSKDEIITSPFSFIATAEAIVRVGAKPVFVDIDPDTFNIDPQGIKRAVSRNTVGIIPVHLYGLACRMDKILQIAKAHHLFIVEDSAQAIGARYKNKKVGTFGDCGAYSFFPSKNLGGYGDAGLVVTNNQRVASLIKILRNHGQIDSYNASFIGYNSRLDSIQAAVLLAKLRYLDKFNRARRRIAQQYNKGLRNIKEVQIPPESKDAYHSYHLYTIRVISGRNALFSYLQARGIEARIYYPRLLNTMRAFRFCRVEGKLSNAKKVSSQILTLPLYPYLTNTQINYTLSCIRRFYKSGE